MARTSIKKNSVKTVNYLNKDFNDFKGNLIDKSLSQLDNQDSALDNQDSEV